MILVWMYWCVVVHTVYTLCTHHSLFVLFLFQGHLVVALCLDSLHPTCSVCRLSGKNQQMELTADRVHTTLEPSVPSSFHFISSRLARHVSCQGCGSQLLTKKQRMEQMVRATSAAIDIPLTVKVRASLRGETSTTQGVVRYY